MNDCWKYTYFFICRNDYKHKLEKAEENQNEVSAVQKECIEKLRKLREEKSEKDKVLKQQAQ